MWHACGTTVMGDEIPQTHHREPTVGRAGEPVNGSRRRRQVSARMGSYTARRRLPRLPLKVWSASVPKPPAQGILLTMDGHTSDQELDDHTAARLARPVSGPSGHPGAQPGA